MRIARNNQIVIDAFEIFNETEVDKDDLESFVEDLDDYTASNYTEATS